MSNIKNEVITKLRSDIKAKLDQIGAFVDNELADYIMVLVANQKTKYQMKDDLSLFLGAETDQFVNWLHNTLKQIQINANQSEDKKVVTNDEKESEELPKILETNSNKSKAKHRQRVKRLSKSDKNSEKSQNNEISEKVITEESTKQSPNTMTVPSDLRFNSLSKDSIETTEESVEQNEDKTEKLEQNDGEVVLRLNPDGEEVDELLQESDVNEDQKNEEKESKLSSNKRANVKPKRRIDSTGLAPTSTIGAVVRNIPKVLEEDDEEEDDRPLVSSVASVVRVTQRKPSVPIELQANKKLLLRAVKDAHDSTNPKKRASGEDYTPTPIKRRLGEKQEVVVNPTLEQELDPQDLRNYLNVTKKDLEKVEELDELLNNNRIVKPIHYKETPEMNPQFVVTLDGVDHNQYMQNTGLSADLEDQLVLDEEVDEELIDREDVEDIDMDEDLENDDLGANRVNEKCRYWPSCKNGDECEFTHPTTPCKTFPNCRFGDKCLYIHPNCKFDSMCSRRDCPFTHKSKRAIPTSPAIISSLLPPSSIKQCKYAPNCKNPACPYFHPKICHFGMKCRSHNCPFIHPNLNYSSLPSVPSLPNPHQYKWKARDHISERQFSVKSTNDSKTRASD